jgi:hypothetical protein
MTNAVYLLGLGMLAAGTAAGLDAQAQRPAQASDVRTRDIYVGVVDSKGVAATGLTAGDFAVREDGVAREVLRAVPAEEPLDIVLLVDDSQASTRAIPNLRDGLGQFIDRLSGKASIGIVTIGERPTSVVERTTDVAALKKGVSRIFARPGTGAYFLEGIIEVSRGFQMREAKRPPVIVALSMEGVEFSNTAHERVLEELYKSGATLHVLAIGNPVTPTSDELRNKAVVAARGTQATGGRREQLLSEMGIAAALTQLAGELVNQYVVTYGRPDTLVPPQKVQVTVTKPGLTARARTHLPQTRK